MSPESIGEHGPERIYFGSFTFAPNSNELFRDGEPIDLPPTPGRLLAFFAARPGEIVSRVEIWDAIWPDEKFDLDQRLNYAVHQLRKVLDDDPAEPKVIRTFPRRGYRFLPEVHSRDPGPNVDREPVREIGSIPVADIPDPPGSDEVPLHDESRRRPPRLRLWGYASVFAAAIALGALLQVSEGPAQAARQTSDSVGSTLTAAPSAAEEQYLIGRHLLDLGGAENALRSEALFWEAIEIDSTYAPAWLGVGLARDRRLDTEVARTMLRRALQVDSTLATAHHVLGRMAFDRGRWEEAQKHLDLAIRFGPEDAGPHHLMAHLAVVLDDAADAVEHIEEARRLDPALGLQQGDTGWIYYWAGRFADALATCRASEELRGPDSRSQACLMSSHLAMGELDRAADLARDLMQAGGQDPNPDVATGPPDALLRRFFAWRLDVLSGIEGSDYGQARVAAFLGDADAALESLEIAAARNDRSVWYATAEPAFEPLRDHPRFVTLQSSWGVRNAAARSR